MQNLSAPTAASQHAMGPPLPCPLTDLNSTDSVCVLLPPLSDSSHLLGDALSSYVSPVCCIASFRLSRFQADLLKCHPLTLSFRFKGWVDQMLEKREGCLLMWLSKREEQNVQYVNKGRCVLISLNESLIVTCIQNKWFFGVSSEDQHFKTLCRCFHAVCEISAV